MDQGHGDSHPTKSVLKDCWEHQESVSFSFGWVGDAKAQSLGLTQLGYSPTVPSAPVPPWLFVYPDADLSLQKALKNKSKHIPEWFVVQKALESYGDSPILYTDGSKDPSTAGAAVNIPFNGVGFKKRLSDHLAVYSAEMIAVALAINWLLINWREGVNKAVIASDSQAALQSIKTGKMDLLYKLYQFLLQVSSRELSVVFVWVPAHVGVEYNEEADILAKQALKLEKVNVQVPLESS